MPSSSESVDKLRVLTRVSTMCIKTIIHMKCTWCAGACTSDTAEAFSLTMRACVGASKLPKVSLTVRELRVLLPPRCVGLPLHITATADALVTHNNICQDKTVITAHTEAATSSAAKDLHRCGGCLIAVVGGVSCGQGTC